MPDVVARGVSVADYAVVMVLVVRMVRVVMMMVVVR